MARTQNHREYDKLLSKYKPGKDNLDLIFELLEMWPTLNDEQQRHYINSGFKGFRVSKIDQNVITGESKAGRRLRNAAEIAAGVGDAAARATGKAAIRAAKEVKKRW